jgi:hypothetical protein
VSGCPGFLSAVNNIPVGFGRQIHTHPIDHTGIVTKQILNHINTRCIDEVKPIPSIYQELSSSNRRNMSPVAVSVHLPSSLMSSRVVGSAGVCFCLAL